MSEQNVPPVPPQVPPAVPPPPPDQPPLIPPEMSEAIEEMGGTVSPMGEITSTDPHQYLISESPFSFYTVVYRVFNGGTQWVGVTARGTQPIEALNNFEALMNECARRNWEPPKMAQPAENFPTQPPSGYAASHPPTPPPNPTAPPSDDGVVDRGTGDLHSITVEIGQGGGNNRVKFMVGRLNYPLSDARDPETIANLFDKDLGMTANHFRTPTVYDARTWGWKADWHKKIKNTKDGQKTYYDIIRIHK